MLAEKYIDEITTILKKIPTGSQKRSAVMPLLYLAQREQGYVTRNPLMRSLRFWRSHRPRWHRLSVFIHYIMTARAENTASRSAMTSRVRCARG